jgi:hypothetical protein
MRARVPGGSRLSVAGAVLRAVAGAVIAAVIAAVLGLLGAGPARADEQPVVAVLPLSAPSPRMGIYGAPVAKAVARHVRAQGKFRVEALELDDVLPQRVDLVIDGRIVKASGSAVRLEARVRDPGRGVTAAVVVTGARPLGEIDRLAEELAGVLAEPLDAAMNEARRRPAAEVDPGEPRTGSAVTGQADRPAAPGQPAPATPATSDAKAPPMVIFGAVGEVAGGAVPVADVATRASHDLARRLGFRPVPAAGSGVPTREATRAALAKAGAAYGLILDVRDVRFSWSGVLLGRGDVRAIMFDSRGYRVYDSLRSTDTVVGSRGDHHAAVVRFVLEQATDIFAPELARAMRRQAELARVRGSSP